MSESIWSLGIYGGVSPLKLSGLAGAVNPVLVPADVTDLKVDILAHPFLARGDSGYWMFFTAKHGENPEYSAIGAAHSADGVSWKYRQIVLREQHVVAYPQVIPWRGQHYMLVESYHENFVRLYRATEFPLKWEPAGDVLSGDHFVSPSLVRFGEMWWMFAGGLDNASLRLFWAKEIAGPWTEHAKSPIVKADLGRARPAGGPVVIDGVLHRFGQDCATTYGRRVFAFAVTKISPTEYEERKIDAPVVSATGRGWNAEAMHHVDALEVAKAKWIAAVDARGAEEE